MRHDDLRKQPGAEPLPPLDLSLTPPPIAAQCSRCARTFSMWTGYVSPTLSICETCLATGEQPGA